VPTATSSPTTALARVRHRIGGPEILLGAVAPFVVYQVATHLGAGELAALAWGAVFPLVGIVFGLARRRRLDVISAISVTSITVGLAGGLLLHSAQFLLVKDSLVSATIGLAFLGSLVAARPLIFVIARAQSPERAAVFDARWVEPAFRRALRVMTAAWGGVLLAEAATRVALALVVPPATLLLVSPLLTAAFLGPVVLWTVRRRARLRPAR
jgi:intracellular septation protein A